MKVTHKINSIWTIKNDNNALPYEAPLFVSVTSLKEAVCLDVVISDSNPMLKVTQVSQVQDLDCCLFLVQFSSVTRSKYCEL